MEDWGHALVIESSQRLVRADVTSAVEGVGLPGPNLEVTFAIVERQLVREGSLLSVFKKLLQDSLIPLGMREPAEVLVLLSVV